MKSLKKSISSIAVFTFIKGGGYYVSFPVYPGCVTFVHTIEEAQKKAGEVLELWLEELSANKISIFSQTPIFSEIRVSFA